MWAERERESFSAVQQGCALGYTHMQNKKKAWLPIGETEVEVQRGEGGGGQGRREHTITNHLPLTTQRRHETVEKTQHGSGRPSLSSHSRNHLCGKPEAKQHKAEG